MSNGIDVRLLLQVLGHNAEDVAQIQQLRARSPQERPYLLVYKRSGVGRLFLLAYEMRVQGVAVDFLLTSIAPVDLTTKH